MRVADGLVEMIFINIFREDFHVFYIHFSLGLGDREDIHSTLQYLRVSVLCFVVSSAETMLNILAGGFDAELMLSTWVDGCTGKNGCVQKLIDMTLLLEECTGLIG